MFPSMRLVIAAVCATVVVLIGGFGVFATFRVSHEPFARLPSATAPLALASENVSVPPLAFASAEQPQRRVALRDLPAFPAATDVPAPAPDPAERSEIAPSVANAAPASDTTEVASAAGEPAAPVSQSGATEAAASGAAATGEVAATPPAETANAEAAHDTQPPAASAANDERPLATTLAVVEQPMDQTADPDATIPADALLPAAAAEPAASAARKQADKDAKKAHRVRLAKLRHLRRAAAVGFADSGLGTTQISGYAEANFQSAQPLQDLQFAPPRPRPPIRHAKVVAKAATAKAAAAKAAAVKSTAAKDAKEAKEAKEAKGTNAAKEIKDPAAGTVGPFVSPPPAPDPSSR